MPDGTPSTLTIHIRSLDEALERFRKTPQAVQNHRRVSAHEAACLTSIEAARRLLTATRLNLLHAIRTKQPGSMYEVAKLVGRDLKNVQGDLRLLEKYGLVRMNAGHRAGKRRVRVPEVMFDEIALKITL